MAFRKTEKPATAGTVNGLQGNDHAGRLNNSTDTNSDLITQLNAARARLDTLEALSLWKLDLQARLWREQQAFMFADTDRDFGALADEVHAFKKVSRAIAWKGGAR